MTINIIGDATRKPGEFMVKGYDLANLYNQLALYAPPRYRPGHSSAHANAHSRAWRSRWRITQALPRGWVDPLGGDEELLIRALVGFRNAVVYG